MGQVFSDRHLICNLLDYNSSMQINQPAPDFQLPDLESTLHKLSDYCGQIVIVNFWSAECPHSERADRLLLDDVALWEGLREGPLLGLEIALGLAQPPW